MRRALVIVLLTGCATTAPQQRKPDAALTISVRCAEGDGPSRKVVACPSVADARVYVDDHLIGRAVELEGRALAVPAGSHRVEVRADGWFTAYRDAAVAHAGRATLEVPLRRVPEGETE
jgi:hypothetical protein